MCDLILNLSNLLIKCNLIVLKNRDFILVNIGSNEVFFGCGKIVLSKRNRVMG